MAQIRQKPVAQKRGHAKKNPRYLAQVAKLPCCICEASGMAQTSHTQVHHPICGRFEGRKAPDEAALPFCCDHHQGLRFDRDTSKLAIHRGKETWVAVHGEDTDYIEATQRKILGG